jgi:hypothetical protein
MMTNEQASDWIVLDNIVHGWGWATNLPRDFAEAALKRCEERGWVNGKRITDKGRIALLENCKVTESI